jgi:hypothetical protein
MRNKRKPLAKPNQVAGYGKPPEATRFKKGVSGNPKGRPKGSLNVATILTRSLRKKVVINENGQRRSVVKLEAGIIQQVNKAASGDLRALQLLVAWANDAEQKENLAATQDPGMNELDQQIPGRTLTKLVIRDHKGRRLFWIQMLKDDHRNLCHPEFSGRLYATVANNHLHVPIDHDRRSKAEHLNASHELSNLFVRVDSRVVGVGL